MLCKQSLRDVAEARVVGATCHPGFALFQGRLYMLQDRPYVPRASHNCLCHKPCTSFLRAGKLLRVWSPGATGAWRPLRDGLILIENPGNPVCLWAGTKLIEPPPRSWTLYGEASYDPPGGTGVPCDWVVSLGVNSEIVDCGEEFFTASGTFVIDVQRNCADAPNVVPVVGLTSDCRWPASNPGDLWLCQWVARRDNWEP